MGRVEVAGLRGLVEERLLKGRCCARPLCCWLLLLLLLRCRG